MNLMVIDGVIAVLGQDKGLHIFEGLAQMCRHEVGTALLQHLLQG